MEEGLFINIYSNNIMKPSTPVNKYSIMIIQSFSEIHNVNDNLIKKDCGEISPHIYYLREGAS